MFAQAALGRVAAAWWLRRDMEHAVDAAWKLRARLPSRDRALLDAYAGSRYPTVPTLAERIVAWETAIATASDRADAWFESADLYYHWGDVRADPDWKRRATDGFERTLQLDSTFSGVVGHLVELAILRTDTVALRRFDAWLIRTEGATPVSATRWRIATVLGDSAAVRLMRTQLATSPTGTLVSVMLNSQLYGAGRLEGRDASQLLRRRVEAPDELITTLIARHTAALNEGRPAEGLDLLRALARVETAPRNALRMQVLDALYWDGDTLAGANAADSLAAHADTPAPRLRFQRQLWASDVCLVALWRIAHGDWARPRRAVTMLRTAPAGDSTSPHPVDLACATLLEAELAVATKAPGAEAAVNAAEILMTQTGGPIGQSELQENANTLMYVNLAVARLWDRLGRPDRALTVVRRRALSSHWGTFYLSSYLWHEALFATRANDAAGAVEAKRHYLALVGDQARRH